MLKEWLEKIWWLSISYWHKIWTDLWQHFGVRFSRDYIMVKIQFTFLLKVTYCAELLPICIFFIRKNREIKIFKNKAISMMRWKTPPSDVEMSKKWNRGVHLGFLAAILDWQWSLDKPDSIYYGNNHLCQFWYFYYKVNDRYTKCHILPILHNADRK